MEENYYSEHVPQLAILLSHWYPFCGSMHKGQYRMQDARLICTLS